ncbi:hypothetical protein BG011_007514 [Mortierella polycephala]|uniref:Rad60/SUMO-like domain-containing protein n=1 Tax=Mortierella polycephala TaxID=41804 RepID=A0A9P6TY63_9FUNG|nr:hypothetical protein BG011_007514 [Mortierella polycephala]
MGGKARSDSMGSPLKSPSPLQNISSATSPPQARQRIEDDFFSKARNFRDIYKVKETALVETEPEAEVIEVLEPIALTGDMPVLDFEDEAENKQPEAAVIPDKEQKRKREISLTPPPELPSRRPYLHPYLPITLIQPQPSSSIIDLEDDLDQDVEELDPELLSIAAKITSSSQQEVLGSPAGSGSQSTESLSLASPSQSSLQGSQPNSTVAPIPANTDGTPNNASTSSGTGDGSPDPSRTVQIMLRLIRHPLRVVPPEYEALMKNLETPVIATVKAEKSFKELMQWFCDLKRMEFKDTTFTFRGARLMPSTTPHHMDFPPMAVVDVYEAIAYKYVKEQENLERAKKLAEVERQAEEQAEEQAQLEQQQKSQQDERNNETGAEEEEGEVEYLFIKLRGKDTLDEKIRIKKTTTVQAIVGHYIKVKKISPETPVKLEFDDEVLDANMVIGDTEVEDDDMLFVRVG